MQDLCQVVFLKNLGDKVTLWFNLSQNINALNGNSKLTITNDSEGYDQYFETPKTDFDKGALIIRYTDYNNNKLESISEFRVLNFQAEENKQNTYLDRLKKTIPK